MQTIQNIDSSAVIVVNPGGSSRAELVHKIQKMPEAYVVIALSEQYDPNLIGKTLKILHRSPLTGLIYVEAAVPFLILRKDALPLNEWSSINSSDELLMSLYTFVKSRREWTALWVTQAFFQPKRT